MRCPSCDAAVGDEDARFCPRCGNRLERDEEGMGATRPRSSSAAGSAAALLTDLAGSLWRRLVRGGWPEAGAAAGLAFLVLLIVGALSLLALDLQLSSLRNASFGGALTGVVILSLAVLRVPVGIGGLSISVLPLGWLVVVGAGAAWAARRTVARRVADKDGARRAGESMSGRLAEGAKLGVPFGLLCFAGALVFQFRGGDNPIAANPGAALVGGLSWGALWGALGGALAGERAGSLVAGRAQRLRAASALAYEGILAGGIMLAAAAALALIAALVWAIIAFAGSSGRGLGFGGVIAALVYTVAFLPNVLVTVIVLGLGAAIEVGVRVTGQGQVGGLARSYSLFDWAGAGPPAAVFALLLIPLIACLLGGFAARRRAARPQDMLAVLATAAGTFAVTLTVLAWIGGARVTAGRAGSDGFAGVAPSAGGVLVWALVWASMLGWAGWKVGDEQSTWGRDGDGA